MRTFTALVALAVCAAAASAQPQPGTPDSGQAGTPAMAPSLPPASSAGGANVQFRNVDAAIKDLAEESGTRFWDCVRSLEYLRGDLAATKSRVMARNGGKIPSEQAGLIATKVKRVGRQQQLCIDQTKMTNEHFTMAMRSLAGIEPNNHPGIPARRAKLAAMRQKFNDGLKKLKAEGVAVKPDEGDADGSEGGGQ